MVWIRREKGNCFRRFGGRTIQERSRKQEYAPEGGEGHGIISRPDPWSTRSISRESKKQAWLDQMSPGYRGHWYRRTDRTLAFWRFV